MLQRIQTVYLIMAFIATGIFPFFLPLWTTADGKLHYFMSNPIYVWILGLSTTLTLVSIISYKKRQNQFVMGRLNLILNLVALGLFIYKIFNSMFEKPAISEKGMGLILPLVAILFLVLANKAIKKDEDLVKSVDRIR